MLRRWGQRARRVGRLRRSVLDLAFGAGVKGARAEFFLDLEDLETINNHSETVAEVTHCFNATICTREALEDRYGYASA